MKRIFALLALSLIFTSCSKYSTHGKFITEHHDAWMNGYEIGTDGKEIEKDGKGDKGLVFCRANVKENGKAAPVCYRTKFEN